MTRRGWRRRVPVVAASVLLGILACRSTPPGVDVFADVHSPDTCAAVWARAKAAGDTLADRKPEIVRASYPVQTPRDTTGLVLTAWVMAFVVVAEGRVDTAGVQFTPPMQKGFYPAMRRELVKWRYRPAMYRGCRVTFRFRQPVAIEPDLRE